MNVYLCVCVRERVKHTHSKAPTQVSRVGAEDFQLPTNLLFPSKCVSSRASSEGSK